jgi:GxxExxY protein
MDDGHLHFERQVHVPAMYKGRLLGHYRLDFVVEKLVIVELKAVSRFEPLFEGQLLTYLRVTSLPVGLLLNFNSRVMTAGIHRYVLTPVSASDSREGHSGSS